MPNQEIFASVLQVYENYIHSHTRHVSLEQIFYFLVLKKYFHRQLEPDEKIYGIILSCEASIGDMLGFKASPDAESNPDLPSTFYAISALELMEQLHFYLNVALEEERKSRLGAFITKLQKGDRFLHCLKKCAQCKDREKHHQYFFYALQILEKIQGEMIQIIPKIVPFLEYKLKKPDLKRVFRNLSASSLGKKDFISEEEIREILEFQKSDGGFSFQEEDTSSVNETFWTVMALDASRWMIDFPKAKLASYILGEIMAVDTNEITIDSSRIKKIAQLIVILSYVWKPFVSDIELIIFESLKEGRVIDFDVLAEQGVGGIERHIIDYINSKYKFHLSILENEVHFRQYIRALDARQVKLARQIMKSIENSSQVDLKRVLTKYNMGKLRKDWASMDDLRTLITSMVQHHFFAGSINKRRRLFRTSPVLAIRKKIQRTINVDRAISFQEIIFERERLLDVQADIINFTAEMMRARNNIMKEVESLILVEEVDLARQRMKSSIKNALFDAQFFQKNVEKFQEEFEFLNLEYILREPILRWEKVYGNLRRSFNDIETILLKKIEEVERIQKEKNDLWNLDEFSKGNIRLFQEELDRIGNDNILNEEDPKIEDLNNFKMEFEFHLETFQKIDRELQEKTKKITNYLPETKSRLKKTIEYWIKEKSKLDERFSTISQVLTFWEEQQLSIAGMEEQHQDRIESLKKTIDQLLEGKEGGIEKAKATFNQEIDQIGEKLSSFSSDLIQQIKKQSKAFKFNFRAFGNYLEHQWDITKEKIEEKIAVIRSNFETRIALKIERTGLQDFQQFVESKIEYFQKCLEEVKDEIKRDIKTVKDAVKILNMHIDDHLMAFDQANTEYQALIEKNREIITGFDQTSKIVQFKWTSFESLYRDRLADIRKNGLRYLVRQEVFRTSDELRSYKVPLRELAGSLKINKQDLEQLLTDMIAEGLIAGQIIVVEDSIVLFNELYHKDQKFQHYMEDLEGAIGKSFIKINRLFEKSIEIGNILTNAEELSKRINELRLKLSKTAEKIDDFRRQLGIESNNEVYQENVNNFRSFLTSYEENLALIEEKIDKARKLDGFMEEKLDFLKNMVDSNTKMLLDRIHTEEQSGQTPKISGELKILEKNINSVERDVKNYCKKLWKDSKDFDILLPQIKQNFYSRKQQILGKLSQSRDMIQEEIERKTNQRLRQKFDAMLEEKIDRLNEHLGKIQVYVLRKIATNEFKTAAENLNKKIDEFNEFFDKTKTEIKKISKQYDKKAKGFSVKNQYLMERWNRFTEEFTQVIREKVVYLQSEIIENFLNLAIKAFKNNLVMLSFVSAELGMKKQEVKERLITLIGQEKLAGKFDPDLDIYYEDEEALERLDPETLDFINMGNYKVQMFVKRFKVIAKQYSPIVALIGSSFTIIWYLFLFTGANIVFFLVPLILTVSILYGLFSMRRKEKEIAQGIEEEMENIN